MSENRLPPSYTLHDGFPSVPDYLHLRSASGLTSKTPAQATAAIAGTWFGCFIRHTDTGATVAMGRIIGDGGWYFHIADMAVLPEHQRRGLGDGILKYLLKRIRDHAPRDEAGKGAYVTLFADEAGRKLYANNGFVDAAPKQLGMQMVMQD